MFAAVAQPDQIVDQIVGDLAGNARRLFDAAAQARAAGAALTVTLELSLPGYPPEDRLLRPAFLEANARELAALAAQAGDGVLLVGFAERDGASCYNAVAVLRDGRVAQV
jgi:predicted amidohydrolase